MEENGGYLIGVLVGRVSYEIGQPNIWIGAVMLKSPMDARRKLKCCGLIIRLTYPTQRRDLYSRVHATNKTSCLFSLTADTV